MCGVSIWKDEKSFENGWWRWLHNNVNVFMPLKHMVKMIKFVYFTTTKPKIGGGGVAKKREGTGKQNNI